MGLEDPVAAVSEAGFGEDVLRGILGENADSLLASRVTA
jgi:hypothetical protein